MTTVCLVIDYKTHTGYVDYTNRDEWRLAVRLKSRRALLEFMDFQHLSGRGLARKAGLSPAIVGHLARDPKSSSSRRTCSYRTARAIEEALGCPPGFLFDAEMCPVADNKTRRAA